MKLYLENFRCFKGIHTFDLKDHGITLITGVSGVGKSSIIMAIFFAVTDKCATSKVISHGASTCTVKLEFESWNMVRMRGPKRLLVMTEEKKLIEEEVAQNYIDKHFGKHFEEIAYIPQLYTNSFLFRKPSEKLEVLEKLCFDSVDPSLFKDKCASQIKSCQAKYQLEKGKYVSLKKIVEELYSKNAHVELPCIQKPSDADFLEMKAQLEQLELNESRLAASFATEAQIKDLEERIVSLQNKLNHGIAAEIRDDEIASLELHIQSLSALAQIDLMDEKLIWDKYSRDECAQYIEDYSRDIRLHKEYLEIGAKLKELKFVQTQCLELENKRKDIQSSAEKFLSCPSCEKSLKLCNDELFPHFFKEDSKEHTISSEAKKHNLKKLDDQLAAYQKPLKQLELLEARRIELEEFIDPSEKIQELQSDLERIRAYYEQNKKLEMKHMIQLERKKDLECRLNPRFSSILKEAQELYSEVQTQRRLREELSEMGESLMIAKKKLSSDGTSISLEEIRQSKAFITSSMRQWTEENFKYELYKIKSEQNVAYKNHEHELSLIENELERLQKVQTSLAELKQIILRTEAEFIDNKIMDLNQLINHYTSLIFLDPISITMHAVRKNNIEERVQVQIDIFYRNMNCDIAILSGGEQARLNLAFMLAFAHFFHSPLILLDECTSHLDQDMTELVMELINSSGIPKVILIAHQIVEGNFQQILNIK